jgi:hypothetical protein
LRKKLKLEREEGQDVDEKCIVSVCLEIHLQNLPLPVPSLLHHPYTVFHPLIK